MTLRYGPWNGQWQYGMTMDGQERPGLLRTQQCSGTSATDSVSTDWRRPRKGTKSAEGPTGTRGASRQHPHRCAMVYIVMAYMDMAYTVMAYIVMAYVVMAYIVMAYTAMAHIVVA